MPKSVDECVTKAEEWLERAEKIFAQGFVPTGERGEMVSACADVADTWTRLAELAELRHTSAWVDESLGRGTGTVTA